MATDAACIKHTFLAGSDLSSSQFKFVTMASDGQIDVVGDGEFAMGVLLDKPAAAGRAGEVVIFGVTKVIAGGSIDAGAPIAADSNGEAVAASSNDNVLGHALQSAVDNDVFTILFRPQGEYFA